MADVTTKINIQAETKGLAEATRDSTKLENSLSGIGKSANKSSGGMRQVLKTLRSELKQSIKDSNALGDAYTKQNQQLKALQKEYDNLAKSIRNTSRAKKEDAQQTPSPKGFLASVRRFLADESSGSGRGFGGGDGDGRGSDAPGKSPNAKRGAFTQGLLQGVLPEAFIQRGPGAYRQAAGSLVGRSVRSVAGAGFDLLASPFSGTNAAVSALSRLGAPGAIAAGVMQQSLSAAQEEAGTQRSFQAMMPYLRSSTSPGALATLNTLRGSAGGLGRLYGGLSNNESAAFVAQMAAAGGGLASSYSARDIKEGFAAQAGLGVDAGVSGALARGDQIGATTTSGSSTLARAIADAISLRLEGSDRTRYIQQIAASVENFATTGIKVDAQSEGALGRMFQSSGGYTGTRASFLAQGVSSSLSQLADSGPQNADQMLVLQAAGFDPADPESYYKAQERLDNASPGDRAKIYARAEARALGGMRGMGRYAKAGALRRFAGNTGRGIRIGEALRESSTGISAADLAGTAAPPSADAAMADTAYAGYTNTTEASRTMATMANMQSATGQQYVGGMLEMDKTARAAMNKVAHAGGMFLDFAAKAQKFGADLIGLGQGETAIPAAQAPQ